MKQDVALYLFTVKRRSIPFAFLQMAFGRKRARSIPGVTFAKLMGTGNGTTFTPSDADLQKWAILFVGDLTEVESSNFLKSWRSHSISEKRYLLRPLSSHGHWSKVQPFEIHNQSSTGAVAAITRARLKPRLAIKFWKSIPAVVADLHSQPGLIESFGIGETPIGLQGTFSIWRDSQSLRDFAYKGAAHQRAIDETAQFGWYSEELFARFEVIDTAEFTHVH
jgi:hypothetical protein